MLIDLASIAPLPGTPGYVPAPVFTQAHFGGNALTHVNAVGDDGTLDEAAIASTVAGLRFPGGSVTEKYFDIANPNAATAVNPETGDVVDLLPMQDFLEFAARADLPVTLVVPTREQLSTDTDDLGHRFAAIDEALLRGFIGDVVGGAYGKAEIAAIEIGNEYWGSGRMTSLEYGRVASEMAAIIEDALSQASEAGLIDTPPDILVQMGTEYNCADLSTDYEDLDPAEQLAAICADYDLDLDQDTFTYGSGEVAYPFVANAIILSQFDTPSEIAAVDGVTAHIYSKGESVPASRMFPLTAIEKADWDELLGDDGAGLPRYVTEWNVSAHRDTIDSDTGRGLASAQEMLETLENFPAKGVAAAHVWPIQHNTLTTLVEPQSEDDLTVSGQMFRMMRAALPGLHPLQTVLDPDDQQEVEVAASGQAVHTFVGAGRMVMFLFGGDAEEGPLEVDLSEVMAGYEGFGAARLTVAEGDAPASSDAAARLIENDGSVTVEDGVLSVMLGAHDVMMVEFDGVNFADVTADEPEPVVEDDEAAQFMEDMMLDEEFDDGTFGDDFDDAVDTFDEGSIDDLDCFIASATYRNPWHPDVLLLKAFRDIFLIQRGWGRWATRQYYEVSPWLARHIGRSRLLRMVFLGLIKGAVHAIRLSMPTVREAGDRAARVGFRLGGF